MYGHRQWMAVVDFYPRPPRGGRQSITSVSYKMELISIHALREEGDINKKEVTILFWISIHALREEGDAQQLGKRF